MTAGLDRWTPILVGGAVGGALSVLPPCCLLSCCCCCNGLYFLIGGGVAGAVLARSASRRGTMLPADQGIVVGLGAGLVAALMTSIVFGSFEVAAQIAGWSPEVSLDALRNVPPELRPLVERIERLIEQQQRQALPAVVSVALSVLVHLVLGLVFGAAGGLLGVLIARRPPPDDRGGYAAPASPAGSGSAGASRGAGPESPPSAEVSARGPAPPPSPARDPSSAWDRARQELEEPPAPEGPQSGSSSDDQPDARAEDSDEEPPGRRQP